MNTLISSISGLLPLAIASIASAETSAAATPADAQITAAVWWILGAAGVAVIFNNLFSAWTNLTGRFKEKEGAGPEYVTRQACHEAHQKTEATIKEREENLEQTITELENKLESKSNELRVIVRADIAGVHKRVDAILAAVSELKGRVEAQ